MALNVPGLVVMAGFYLVILGTGIWASMRSKKEEKKCKGDGMEMTLLAGRNINLLVGIFTLTGKAVIKKKDWVQFRHHYHQLQHHCED